MRQLFFLVLFLPACLYGQPYRSLVLKGGGIRGIAYTGAFKVLEEQGISAGIERVGGTSVGAITGALFATGYTAKEMEALLAGLDIATFNDGEWYFIGGGARMRQNFGWYKGQELERWIGERIAKQTGNAGLTLMQLHELAKHDKRYKDLYVTATNLTRQRLEIFSWETHPDMPVKTAVRASVSIPLYYTAVFIDSVDNVTDEPTAGGNVYVDGGLVANYPIGIFNTAQDNANNVINQYTLGLKLERPEQISYQKEHTGVAPYDINTFSGYIGALYNMTMEQLNKRMPYAEEQRHTIYISTSNVNPRVRRITAAQKRLLYRNGEQAAKEFFKVQ